METRPDGRELALLVHNLSHSDAVFAVDTCNRLPANAKELTASFARPEYKSYYSMFKSLRDYIDEHTGQISVLRQQLTDEKGRTALVPIGIALPSPFRVRRSQLTFKDASLQYGHSDNMVAISAIYFPLVSVLMTKWLSALASAAAAKAAKAGPSSSASATPPSKKVCFLISGSSVPDDPEHPRGAGSTSETAVLLLRFLRLAYPEVIPTHLPAGDDVFRYDATVAFLRHALVPEIERHRVALVSAYAEGWAKRFSLTISMAAGAPARLAALNATARQFRPSYLHVNNVKVWWYSGDISAAFSACLALDFETVEGTPSQAVAELDDELQGVVREMKAYAASFLRAVRGSADPSSPPAAMDPLLANVAGLVGSSAQRGRHQHQHGGSSAISGYHHHGHSSHAETAHVHHTHTSSSSHDPTAPTVWPQPDGHRPQPDDLPLPVHRPVSLDLPVSGVHVSGRRRSRSRSNSSTRSLPPTSSGNASAIVTDSHGRASNGGDKASVNTPAAGTGGRTATSTTSTGTPNSVRPPLPSHPLVGSTGGSSVVGLAPFSMAQFKASIGLGPTPPPLNRSASYPLASSSSSAVGSAAVLPVVTSAGAEPAAASAAECAHYTSAPLPPAPISAPAPSPVDNELATFWLRKTRQPVLAVLCVRKPGGRPLFYRSMNLEVSMPTGSLCSERAAISQALAADPGLRRGDIRAVAVLSLPKLDHPDPRVQEAYLGAGVAPSGGFYSGRVVLGSPVRAMGGGAASTPAALTDPHHRSHHNHASSSSHESHAQQQQQYRLDDGASSRLAPPAGASSAFSPPTAAGTLSRVPQQQLQQQQHGSPIHSSQALGRTGRSSSSSSDGGLLSSLSSGSQPLLTSSSLEEGMNSGSGVHTGVGRPLPVSLISAPVSASSAPSSASSTVDIDSILMPPPPPLSRMGGGGGTTPAGSGGGGSGGGGTGARSRSASDAGASETAVASHESSGAAAGRHKAVAKPLLAGKVSTGVQPAASIVTSGGGALSAPAAVVPALPLHNRRPTTPSASSSSTQKSASANTPSSHHEAPSSPAADGLALQLMTSLHDPEGDGAMSVRSTGSASSMQDVMMTSSGAQGMLHPQLSSGSSRASSPSFHVSSASSVMSTTSADVQQPAAKRARREWGGSDSGTATPVRLDQHQHLHNSAADEDVGAHSRPSNRLSGGGGLGAGSSLVNRALSIRSGDGKEESGLAGSHHVDSPVHSHGHHHVHHHHVHHQQPTVFDSTSADSGTPVASASAAAAGTPAAGPFIVTSSSVGPGPHIHLAPSPTGPSSGAAAGGGGGIPVALNPLLPCGSCTEWLRKISEVNPDFAVITFSDISCERVFVHKVPDL